MHIKWIFKYLSTKRIIKKTHFGIGFGIKNETTTTNGNKWFEVREKKSGFNILKNDQVFNCLQHNERLIKPTLLPSYFVFFYFLRDLIYRYISMKFELVSLEKIFNKKKIVQRSCGLVHYFSGYFGDRNGFLSKLSNP